MFAVVELYMFFLWWDDSWRRFSESSIYQWRVLWSLGEDAGTVTCLVWAGRGNQPSSIPPSYPQSQRAILQKPSTPDDVLGAVTSCQGYF